MTKQNLPQSNDLAVASLILGVLSLAGTGPIAGIPAIITGVMGMKNPYNKGMAVAGLVMGIVSTVLVVLGFLLFLLLVFLGVFAASSIDSGVQHVPDTTDSGYEQRRA